jgi:hypothetical protein
MGLFKKEPTLEELEQENEALEIEESNYKHRAQIARLKRQIDSQGGQGFWKKIVGDSKGGNAISKMINWLRNH